MLCLLLRRQSVIAQAPMQKTTSALLGAFVVAAAVIVVWRTGPKRDGAVVVAAVSADRTSPAPSSSATEGTGSSAALGLLEEKAAGVVRKAASRSGTVLLNGDIPGPLPDDAPAEMRFGVLKLAYRGAERAAPSSRTKEDALALALALATAAKGDFKAAVEKGDEGSSPDLGWIQRGVLEPAPNYVLFTLRPGEVGGPVDTPTGYWVMKNLSK